MRGGYDTVRLVGPGILDSPHCGVHATSLHYRVLFKHVCELAWEIWWQVVTSIIRADCNTGRSRGYLEIVFWFRSWCDGRATTVLRTGGRQSYGAGSSSWLFETRPAHQSAHQFHFSPLQAPIPAHVVLNCEQKTKRQIKIDFKKKRKGKEAEGQKLKEGREKSQQLKRQWERMFTFQI